MVRGGGPFTAVPCHGVRGGGSFTAVPCHGPRRRTIHDFAVQVSPHGLDDQPSLLSGGQRPHPWTSPDTTGMRVPIGALASQQTLTRDLRMRLISSRTVGISGATGLGRPVPDRFVWTQRASARQLFPGMAGSGDQRDQRPVNGGPGVGQAQR
jgi:hypothetical protein